MELVRIIHTNEELVKKVDAIFALWEDRVTVSMQAFGTFTNTRTRKKIELVRQSGTNDVWYDQRGPDAGIVKCTGNIPIKPSGGYYVVKATIIGSLWQIHENIKGTIDKRGQVGL